MGMSVNAGELRDYAEVEEPVRTRDATGQERVTGWQEAFVAYCQVATLSGTELVTAQAIQHTASHSVRARYREEWNANLRLRINNATLYVDAVLPDTTRTEVVLICSQDAERDR
jgi:SPP1 family predicted phage head-tail adaptor